MVWQRFRELIGLLSGGAVLLAAGPALAIDMPWSFPKDSGTWIAAVVVAGVIVVGSVLFIDRVHIDDPVGAVSVHLVCGIWGTLAVGIFSADHPLATQVIGVLAYGAISFPSALLIFFALKQVMGLRVSAEEERIGLDVGEHGMEAYQLPPTR